MGRQCGNPEDEGGRKKQEVRVEGAVIVGAGPSGLATAASLAARGVSYLLLERCDCIASLWRHRTYDRLRLHLPRTFCELPLMGFPAGSPKYPTKHQFLAYMDAYASRFDIKPRFGQTVERAEFDSIWRVHTQDSVYASRWLIVATGENAEPFSPEIPGMETFGGRVTHTSGYRSGSEFENQRVLVVGCGNSGMEVSLDLCRHNSLPHMVVRNTVHVLPREILGLSTFGIAMALLKRLPLRLVDRLLLLAAGFSLGDTDRLGLRRPKTGPIELKNATGKTPVLDVGAISQIRSGKIKLVRGVKEVSGNVVTFVDGQELEFDAIIFATGYRSNVPHWLKRSDFFTAEGMPRAAFPNNWKAGDGLYTAGFSRRGLLGTSWDATSIAGDIAEQCRSGSPDLSSAAPASSCSTNHCK